MIFSWLRQRRRKRLLARPFPAEWADILRQNVAVYCRLSADERARLGQRIQVFVAEKYWEGCNGLEITDEIKVTIAGQACLLVLGLDGEYFDRLVTVLVYPSEYVATETTHGPGGVVTESTDPRLGETWHRGPVILSWPSVLAGGRVADDGDNVVLHEFAHFLDTQDYGFDGTPPLEDSGQYRTWQEVMTAEYNQLVKRSRKGRPTLLDHYGAKNEAEFFAVATEHFFEQPIDMQTLHPQLYETLRLFYRQDPAAWFSREPGHRSNSQ